MMTGETPLGLLKRGAVVTALLAAATACGSGSGSLFGSAGNGGDAGSTGTAGAAGSSGSGSGGTSSGGTAGSAGSSGSSGGGGDAGASGSAGSTGAGGAAGASGASGTGGQAGASGAAGGGGCPLPTTFYADADGDGQGDPNVPVVACARPPGAVANDDDCWDGNPDAKTGQTDWFGSDRGDGSYDYDCDNAETRRTTAIGACSLGICAVLREGWQGSAPACGDSHGWVTACTGIAFCAPQTEMRVQECH